VNAQEITAFWCSNGMGVELMITDSTRSRLLYWHVSTFTQNFIDHDIIGDIEENRKKIKGPDV